jgi:hypothetical protein
VVLAGECRRQQRASGKLLCQSEVLPNVHAVCMGCCLSQGNSGEDVPSDMEKLAPATRFRGSDLGREAPVHPLERSTLLPTPRECVLLGGRCFGAEQTA